MLNVKTVAERLAKSETEVIEQSLRSYLVREIGLIETELQRYRERYNVLTPQELHQRIRAGAISTHPAWEDYLEWVNGLDAIDDLHDLLHNAEL